MPINKQRNVAIAIGAGLGAALLALSAQRFTLKLLGGGAIVVLILAPALAALIPVAPIYAEAEKALAPELAPARRRR